MGTGALPAGGGRLRLPVTDLHGRRDDVEAVSRLLGEVRLVSLVGPGGVGKTRLATEIAAGLAAAYDDGVWLCELAPVNPASDVVEAIATQLGVKHRETEAASDAVVAWLAPRRALVVLDNCEHVLSAVRALVPELLGRCPTLTVLVTSREALDVDGEWRWRTAPLAVPSPAVTDPGEAARYEAVTLFAARAKAASQDFVLSGANAATVSAICRRLDGLPLALELAAARVPALGCAELLAHLDRRFQLLAGNEREPRRTLRGAVDWSYALLAPDQQRLFRWLSVFAGSWDLDAAREVCGGEGGDGTDLLNAVLDLVAKSLVTAAPTPAGLRYQLLETLRHYGRERLEERGEAEAARAKYGEWACSLARRARRGLRGPDEGASGDLVRTELDNLRAAVAGAIADRDADVAFTIVACLEDYTMLRLDFEVAAWAERFLAVDAWHDEPRRHRALGLVAHAAWARGDHDAATRWGREAIALERRDDREPSWSAWQAVGDAAWFRGRPLEALAHFREWAERALAVDDDFHLTVARTHLVVATTVVEPDQDVLPAADDAVALARRCGTPSLIALALYAKGECLVERDPAGALALVSEGAAISRGSGNRFAFGLCLATLASLTGRLGDPARAVGLYREAVENWHAAGNWANQRILLRNLAEFAPRAGAPALTPRLLGALAASGEMLGAEISEEGRRLAAAIAAARRALGDDRYDGLHADGASAVPHALGRETVEALAAMTVVPARSSPPPGRLSAREWEVLSLISDGLENREIAARLFISERTVDTHVTRIRRKLGATTRTQVAVWGADHGARAGQTTTG